MMNETVNDGIIVKDETKDPNSILAKIKRQSKLERRTRMFLFMEITLDSTMSTASKLLLSKRSMAIRSYL